MKKNIFRVVIMVLLLMNMVFWREDTLYAFEGRNVPKDFGEPVNITYYTDEEGNNVTEKIYIVADGKSTRAKSGAGWYKNEKTIEWSSGSVSTYYA